VGSGLVGKGGELTGFELAGADKKLYPAQATFVNRTLVVTSPDVPKPVALRFGWANYPQINLWNEYGFPAHPFRTDDWEVAYQNAK
jgi:sialate O-acetylesterase